MTMTRRAAVKAGLGTALSALGLSASRADVPSHQGKEGNVPMSHHLDTPLAAQNGQLYIDDLYVFSGADSTVFIMDVNSDITGVHVKPGFHHEARYEFKVHFDGASFETLTYRVSFDEVDSEGRQAMRMHALSGGEASDDAAVGKLVLEGRTGEAASAGGARLWAGHIVDPFYIDLSLLGKVNGAVKNGTAVDLSGWNPADAKNSFAGKMVESIVLEVSHQHPQLKPGARIGVWCATKLATDAGGWRQINRGGHPMIWPIFRPDDTHFTNPADSDSPFKDFEAERRHMLSTLQPSSRPAVLRGTRRATARLWPGSCSPISCPTWSGRPRPTASPPETAGRWLTTPPKSCCLSSLARPCPPG